MKNPCTNKILLILRKRLSHLPKAEEHINALKDQIRLDDSIDPDNDGDDDTNDPGDKQDPPPGPGGGE